MIKKGMISIKRSMFLTAILAGTLVGCATNTALIQARMQSARMDLFSEISGKEEIPKGYADLEIRASIKTPTSGFFFLESKDSVHGKPGYPFLLNVDGQAVVWKVDGQTESAPRYLKEGLLNPERGIGVRYVRDKRIRLKAGTHRIFLALPGEDYYRETDVSLKEGRLHVLLFEPVYKWGFRKSRIFLSGLEEYETTLVCVGND